MMASKQPKEKNKFHRQNNVFISATDEISATDLQRQLIDLILERVLPFGTTFYLIGGIHHGINRNQEVEMGITDFTLLQGFYHQVYSKLTKLEAWDKMNFRYVLVPITTTGVLDMKTFREEYKLSEISKRELTRLAKKLQTKNRPAVVIFASCYSFESAIKNYFYANGLMAWLNISGDRGKVTDGKEFTLDDDQLEVVNTFAEVNN